MRRAQKYCFDSFRLFCGSGELFLVLRDRFQAKRIDGAEGDLTNIDPKILLMIPSKEDSADILGSDLEDVVESSPIRAANKHAILRTE